MSFQSSKTFFVPFLSAFTQDIVSRHPSSSLGDLHLIRSSRNDISQPAAWHCGSAKQQIQVVDFFSCWHFWKSWINSVYPLDTVWVAIFTLIPVPLQDQSYRTEEVGHPHMKTGGLEGWKGMLWDLKISSLKTKSREMGHVISILTTMQSKRKRRKSNTTHWNLYNWF